MFPGSYPACHRWQYTYCKRCKDGRGLGTRLVVSDFAYKLSCTHVLQAAWAAGSMGFIAVRNGHRVHRKWLKIPTQCCLFVSEMCMMLGSRFLRQLNLLHTTSHVFKVHTYMFSLQKNDQAKIRPAQPLATAMHGVLSITMTYLSVEAWISIYGL